MLYILTFNSYLDRGHPVVFKVH